MMVTVAQTNPYIGPRSFHSGEKLYGRTREITDLLGLLVAERIVVLHSPSGAGKTSLLQASLLPRLEAKGFWISPVIRVSYDPRSCINDSDDTIAQSLNPNRYVLSTLLSLEEDVAADQRLPMADLARMTLVEYLCGHLARDDDDIVLVFDQFEEVFTTDPTNREAKIEFFKQLGEALQFQSISEEDECDAANFEYPWALFSMREDYIASLEPYSRFVPTRFKNHFRLDLLSVKAAQQAIQEPVKEVGVTFCDDAIEHLINELRLVRVQQPDGTLEEVYGPFIEPVELQVVCHRLWNSLPEDANEITITDLSVVGSVDTALAGYYADQVAAIAQATGVRERTIREWFDQRLITSQGIRGQVLQGREESEGLANSAIQQLIETHLVRGERRRGAIWFELAHDRLISPVRTDNEAWFEQNLHAFQRQTALWEKQGRPDGMLFTDDALVEAERWADQHIKELTITELDFLEACFRMQRSSRQREEARQRELEQAQALAEEQQRRATEAIAAQRRLRQRSVFLVITMLIALMTTVVAAVASFHSYSAHMEAERMADEASTLALERSIYQTLTQDDPNEALALLLATVGEGRPVPSGMELLSRGIYHSARRNFIGHTRSINSVAFSPDGNTILSGSDDGTMRLWDVESSTELQLFSGHTGWVNSVAFSPDGRTLLSGSDDQTLRLWDAASGAELRQFTGHTDWVWSVAFSPDGRTLLSGSEDQTMRLWDVQSGEELQRFRDVGHPIKSVAFSPDGRLALCGSEDGTLLIWDIASGEQQQELSGHTDSIDDIAFHPDGHLVLSASADRTVRMWDIVLGEEEHHFIGHTDGVMSIHVSPDGLTAISGSLDGTIRLWDVESGYELRRFAGHTGEISTVAFHPDGDHVVSGSWDGTLRVWDVAGSAELQQFKGHSDIVYGVAFSPDGKMAFSASWDSTLCMWDVAQGDLRQCFHVGSELDDVHVSPDGTKVLATSEDTLIRVWDLEHSTEPDLLDGHTEAVVEAVFSSDSRTALSVSFDKTIRLWDVERGEEIQRLTGHNGVVWSAAFSPDDTRVLSGSADRTLRLWDVASGDEIQRFWGHEDMVRSVAFSPDGTKAVSASDDQTIRLWDVESGEELQRLTGHESSVRSVAFSPDGQHIVSGSVDRTVRVWDVERGREVLHLEGHTDRVHTVAFSPDGRSILSGSADTTMRLWRVDTPEQLIEWARTNRYIPELTCEQRHMYTIEPLCDESERTPLPDHPE